MKFFTRVPFLKIFLEKFKIFIFLLLYEFSRGNQVDGSPRVAIVEQEFLPEKSNSKGRRFLSKRRVIPKQ